MGFDFSSYLMPWGVGGTILLFAVGLNTGEITDLMNGLNLDYFGWVKFLANAFIFLFFLAIVLIPPVRNNLYKLLDLIFGYPVKVLEKFFR
ncbi:hypothetical protein COX58_00930 [archaeon CG_4_10_14_0_2_um_filter_Archaea_38_6]|nr:MAG: hypothetical protein COX58_00930 [archaeon CG_4_10_14_0_2_um_filter_Archaea_38_6]